MSGDLEDFLRRAAQRRQSKAAQSSQPTPRARQRPQYSDSRTERVVRTVESEDAHDEVLAATVVEDDDPNSFTNRRKKLEKVRAEAERAKAEAAAKLRRSGQPSAGGGAAATLSGHAATDLLAALRNPSGIRQAILLREILERPTHRW